MSSLPTLDRRYEHFIWDSARWQKFTFRPSDIIVCTSYKAGTTWTQMICALLIHQTPDLPRPIAEMAPWLDMRLSKIDDVVANLEAQKHRRFVKTHTPLDGLPYREDVQYVFCGRDPRDVFMSMLHHRDNSNFERMIEILKEMGEPLPERPSAPLPDDINEMFEVWLTTGSFDWEDDGYPFWSHFAHAATFWKFRHLPNIHFLHYADLKKDLEGEMRRLAGLLGIDIPEEQWPALVKAATFDEMKANADKTAPDTNHGTWKNNAEFFHKGKNAQWKGVLTGDSLARYDSLTRERYDNAMVDWLEQGGKTV